LAWVRCELITSIVLAGGKSSRLGTNKAIERIGDTTLLQRVIYRLEPLSVEILIVVGAEVDVGGVRSLKARVVSDVFPQGGSFGGLFSGLQAAKTFHSLAVACDMPFLNQALLRHLVTLSSGYDVVIPRLEDKLEPLHAVYSKNCLVPMVKALDEGRRRIVDFFCQVKVRYVEEEELRRFDAELLSFFNINTPEDLVRARALELERPGQGGETRMPNPEEVSVEP